MKNELVHQQPIKLLIELREICQKEGGEALVGGINSVISWLASDDETKDGWRNARAGYKTMAEAKSGLSDFYVERDTFEERLLANARLDQIRKELWTSLGQ